MKKCLAFKLNGKPMEVQAASKTILNIRNFLVKMKDGELLTSSELAAATGYSYGTIHNGWISTKDPMLAPFRARVRYPRICVVWGNAKTIRELLKHKELIA